MNKLASITALLLLSACGGGGHDGSATMPPVVTPPAVMLDAFFKSVMPFAGASQEEKEPEDVDTVSSTMPEDTEPERLE